MRYAVMQYIGFSSKPCEVWDSATVALSERYTDCWQVFSWHQTKSEAIKAAREVGIEYAR
jgi:hypothetical protein